jgi:cytochrome c
MKVKLLMFAAAALLSFGTAHAQSGAELAKAKGCMNCHDMEAKKVGPSFKEIAAKKGNKDAIVAKLKEGKGHMKVAASDAELNTLVQYVLAAK